MIGECVNQMSRAVHEYGGTVQAYMGDGICAYFGVPTAHEDDPERAARAALRIVDVVRRVRARRRAGVGDRAIRRPRRHQHRPGRGRRRGRRGSPDRRVRRHDQRRSATADRCRSRHDRSGRGVRPPPRASLPPRAARRALRARPRGAGDRTRARRASACRSDGRAHSAPLVGRRAELDRLQHRRRVSPSSKRGRSCYSSATRASGRPACSRSFGRSWRSAPRGSKGQCLSYGGLPAWPFEEMLRGWLAIGEAEPEIAARTRPGRASARLLGSRPGRRACAVRRPAAHRPRPGLDAGIGATSRRRRRSGGPSATGSRRSPRNQPVVIAVEDLHWAAPQARELAEALLRADRSRRRHGRRDASSRARPRRHGGSGCTRSGATPTARPSSRLAPLVDGEAAELVEALAAGSLDDATSSWVVAAAEGNPLYPRGARAAPARGGGSRAATAPGR